MPWAFFAERGGSEECRSEGDVDSSVREGDVVLVRLTPFFFVGTCTCVHSPSSPGSVAMSAVRASGHGGGEGRGAAKAEPSTPSKISGLRFGNLSSVQTVRDVARPGLIR